MTRDQHFDAINRMVPTLGPIQAYCLGLATVLAMQTGRFPPQSGLDLFARCETIREAVELFVMLGGKSDAP